jgi:hypothetical protein
LDDKFYDCLPDELALKVLHKIHRWEAFHEVGRTRGKKSGGRKPWGFKGNVKEPTGHEEDNRKRWKKTWVFSKGPGSLRFMLSFAW